MAASCNEFTTDFTDFTDKQVVVSEPPPFFAIGENLPIRNRDGSTPLVAAGRAVTTPSETEVTTTVQDVALVQPPIAPATAKPLEKPGNTTANDDPVAGPSEVPGLETTASIVLSTTPTTPSESEVTSVKEVAPVLSPIAPATAKPLENPGNTTANDDPVAEPSEVAGLETTPSIALSTTPATTFESEVTTVKQGAPVLSPIAPATAKPLDKPANTAASDDPVAGPSKIAGWGTLPTIAQTAPTEAQGTGDQSAMGNGNPNLGQSAVDPPAPASGTPVAINGQRMKSASQAKEIAGLAAQKLPPALQTASAAREAVDAIPAARSSNAADFSDPKESAGQWTIVNSTVQTTTAPTQTTNAAGAGMPSIARIEQVERLIGREAVVIRESGADTLAVSLKVDSRTSLFLQLTNHHGQIEASVRCESGDAGALDAHWKQLQESLARQNVQLLPLENKTVPAGPSSDVQPETTGNFQDGPSARQQQPCPPGPPAEKPSDDAMKAAIGISKPKSKLRRHPGWEEWA
jgi:hypothetical protein